MKTRVLLAWCLIALLAFTSSASAKNAIYKGVYSVTDLVEGTKQNLSIYIVFGNEEPVSPTTSGYSYLNGAFVIVGGPLGKKRFALSSAGPRFRSLEKEVEIKKKTRTVEIISQVNDGSETDSGNGFHSMTGIVLVGRHTNIKYTFPVTLQGSLLQTNGGVGLAGEPPFGGAQRGTLRLQLVSSLTDPIPSTETLEDSVKRVTDFLEKKGFVEFLP